MPPTQDDTEKAKETVKQAARELSQRASELGGEAKDAVEDSQVELAGRLDELRDQVAALAQRFEDFAAERLDDVREIAAETADRGGRAVQAAGRRAQSVGAAVREDPLPVVVGLGIIALLTALLIGRSNSR
jgi:hypothetical protein